MQYSVNVLFEKSRNLKRLECRQNNFGEVLLHAAEDLPIGAVQDAKVDLLGDVLNGDGLQCGAQEVQADAIQTLLQKKVKVSISMPHPCTPF